MGWLIRALASFSGRDRVALNKAVGLGDGANGCRILKGRGGWTEIGEAGKAGGYRLGHRIHPQAAFRVVRMFWRISSTRASAFSIALSTPLTAVGSNSSRLCRNVNM